MISLYVFLIAWLVFLGLYTIMLLLSALQLLRFGVSGAGTYLATLVFFVGVILVVVGTGAMLRSVDWQQQINLFSWINAF